MFGSLMVVPVMVATSASGAPPPEPDPDPNAAIKCIDEVTSDKSFYGGPRASDAYDNRFTDSHTIPHLDSHVPQGTATWSNWKGEDDLILITSYVPGSDANSYISALDAESGKLVGTAEVDASHVGGIAVFEEQGWAFIVGDGEKSVWKYPLDRLRQAIENSSHIAKEGGDIAVAGGSSFLTSHGPSDTLWTGSFEPDKRGEMYSYKVNTNGELSGRDGPWEVPTKTQGLVVTDEVFLYSTSYTRPNRSNIYAVRRGEGSTELDTARLRCFRAPSMSQGLTVFGDHAYLAFESGAAFYRKDPDNQPRNIIEHLHKVEVAELEALPPRTAPTR
ncbi:hypothetical protein JK358_38430 [Nocardia sp. 2]|uniref:Uncharacterized protein n=1 Tax=Nocardia acididurans TaxID=2802282 RepID=A0ABS1MKV6_9NOCA|nr:hypothetical protein [Nocardia acididurans]MBL1080289.1 hypothetical protein [Nocardia acididurans]